jgi:predicted MFS family arabinose efflux permease
VAAAVFPLLGSWLIKMHGWQTAVVIQAGVWVVIVFPVLFFFFRGAHDRPRKTVESAARRELAGVSLGEGLRSTVYLRLLLASLFFTFTIIALVVHFVPILTGRGADPVRAAGVASLIGFSSIAGRLVTGVMLDRFRGSLVGAGAFMLPALGSILLLVWGDAALSQAVAAVLIGLTLGAEVDVIVYLTTRHFGLKNFGALYGGLLAALSIGTAVGPLSASMIFDRHGSYAPFLWLTIAFMVASGLTLASLPKPASER